MNLQASLDRFHGKLYNGVLGVHNAPFSSPLPTHLLSSFFLSVSLSSHLSFVPFFLHSDHNGIWQDFVTSSNLPFREQEQKTWSKETEREGRRRGRENWHTHTHTIYANVIIRASLPLSSHLFHRLRPVLTWLARSEIDAWVSNWERTQSWHFIHGLHLSIPRTHRCEFQSLFFPIYIYDTLQRLRNKDRHVQRPLWQVNKRQEMGKYLSIMNKE